MQHTFYSDEFEFDGIKINEILSSLPSGSGFDDEWKASEPNNGKQKLHTSYHVMDDNGMYNGWRDVELTLFLHQENKITHLPALPKKKIPERFQVINRKGQRDFEVEVKERSSDCGLKEYIDDTIMYSLEPWFKNPMPCFRTMAEAEAWCSNPTETQKDKENFDVNS